MRLVLPLGHRSAVVTGPFMTAVIGFGVLMLWCLVLAWWTVKWFYIMPLYWLGLGMYFGGRAFYRYARRLYLEDKASGQPPEPSEPPDNPAQYSNRR